ncbi:hypothetical protein R84B8_02768 [Treponema sp. R8-4-B8]
MAKIGKIFLAIFIFGGIFVFPAVSQQQLTKAELQIIYFEYLCKEGYNPSIDKDGDILFKVSGNSYFIIVDENDPQFFQVYMGFKMDTISTEDALNAVNYSNRCSKVVKVYFSADRKVVSITAELLLNDPKDFIPVFSRTISLIQNAENNFISQLK